MPNWQRLTEDAGKVVVDIDTLIKDLQAVVADLQDEGISPQAYFASFARGEVPVLPAAHAEIAAGSVNWQKLFELLKKYGPQIYALLAAIFGWPPIPFPIPSEG
jgi:hypothetical protein